MKALLLKDWYLLKNTCKSLALMVVVFFAVGFASGENLFFLLFGCMMLAMTPVTIMGLEEGSRWQPFALTLPFTRRQLVLEKYLLGLIGLGIGTAVMAALSLVFSVVIVSLPELVALAVMLGLVYLAVSIPCCFWLGIAKGRIISVMLICAACSSIGALAVAGAQLPQPGLFWPLAGVLLLCAGSLGISLKIYQKKEF